jgi:hypothetical protein
MESAFSGRVHGLLLETFPFFHHHKDELVRAECKSFTQIKQNIEGIKAEED